MNQQKNTSMKVALMTAVISFALFVFAIKVVVNTDIDINNIIAYVVASLVFGSIAAVLARFRFRSGLFIYLIALAGGFLYMIYTFSLNLDGWQDLAGLISLFLIAAIGLGLALVVSLIQYLMYRNR